MKLPLEIANTIKVDMTKDVSDVMMNKILSCQSEDSYASFFVCDLGKIVQKYKLWLELLPRVKPFFDIRCNDDAAVLTVLSKLDVGFNCNSKSDIKMVLDQGGISASRLIYSAPCKLTSHVKYAASHGVQTVVFESEAELHKIKSFHPNARLLLKLLPPETSNCNQSAVNFGCHLNNVSGLLSVAKQLRLAVVGVSIQTKDQCFTADCAAAAVALAYSVFEMGKRQGFNMTLLDIGESIREMSSAELSLKESCSIIQMALNDYFPKKSEVTIIAEAGRFFVESAFALATRVINKTVIAEDLDGVVMATDSDLEIQGSAAVTPDIIYYLSDGIFGSFSGILYDGLTVKPALIDCERFAASPRHASRLLGPSQDSLDCILRNCYLPELCIGDWVLFHDMGAYAMAGSTFGLDDEETMRPKCHYTMCAKDWIHLCCCSTASGMSQHEMPSVDVEPLIEWLDA